MSTLPVKEVRITRITGRATKENGHLYWNCLTEEGDRVNVFRSDDPTRDSFHLFLDAGYAPELVSMDIGSILNWSKTPIRAYLDLSGKWATINSVVPRPDGAAPDPSYTPDLDWFSRAAMEEARAYLAYKPLFVDVESTGIGPSAEITSIAILDYDGLTLVNNLVQPVDLAAAASTAAITGITPDDLQGALALNDPYTNTLTFDARIRSCLHRAHWCGYQIDFDRRLIAQSLARRDLAPIFPMSTFDVMACFAQYARLWDATRESFVPIKLALACASCGISLPDAHHALEDIQATWQLIRRIAAGEKLYLPIEV